MDTRTSPASSALPVVSDLERRLNSLRQTIRRTTFIGGVALTVRLLCICLAVAFLIDTFWEAPRLVRVGLLAATGAALAVIFAVRVLKPSLRRIEHDELAALVESAHPEMQERLLSSLELARSGDSDAVKGSSLMREQLLRETARATRDLEFDEVVDSSSAVRQTIIACGAFLLVLSPFLVLQEGYGNLWARFFNPWGNYARGTTLTLEVLPGDAVVPRGEDFAVSALPHFRFGKSKAMTGGRVAWTDDDGECEFRELKPVPDQPAYAAVIPQISRGLRYRVESDQGASREYRVEVVERPTITGLTVDVQPPAYCGRAAQRIDGLVGETTVFERSRLKFMATFNKPVAEVRWLWLDDVRHKYDGKPLEATGRDRLKSASMPGLAFAREDAQLMTVDASGLSATWELTADREGAFEIVLLDEAGIQNRSEPGRSFRILRDGAPVVAWADNETHPTARPDDVVAFEVTAADDIGLGALELHFAVLPHRTQASVLKTDAALLGGQEFSNRFPIDLRKLTAPEGTLIAVKARAADERPVPGPNEAWTSERVIAITRDAAAFGSSELNQRHQRIRDRLAALRQEAIAREEEAAAQRQKARDGQQKGLDEQVFRSETDQLSVREEQLKERLQQTAAEVLQEGLLANLSPRLNEIADQNVATAVAETMRALDATQDARPQALQQAEQQLGEAAQKLTQVEQRFEELAKLEKDLLELNRIADKTERLANDVADFEQQRRELAKQQRTAPANSEQASAAQKDLETQRRQLQQEQRELSKNLQDVLNRRPEVVEAARADLMERLKNLGQRAEQLADKEDRLSEAMKRAGEQNAKSLQQEAARQEELRDEVRRLAAQVANEQRQRLVPTPDLSRTDEAARQLQQGNPQAAAAAQLKAAEELEQLARALERNQQLPADPQAAASELARRQQEIKQQLEKTLEDAKQNNSAPSRDELQRLAAEQAAVQAATARLEVPPSNEGRRNEALKDGGRTLEELLSEKPENAVAQADRARSRLEQLAREIGSPDERAKRLARDADQLRKRQAEIAKKVEQARDDDRANGRPPVREPASLADPLLKQREIARQAAGLDLSQASDPARAAQQQSEAVRAAAEALQKLQSGNAEDAAPAARAAERALADLEKMLNNRPTRDDELQRLIKEQQEIAEASKTALGANDAKGVEQARARQQKQADQLQRLDAPDAPAVAQEAARAAADAAQKLSLAGSDENQRPAAEQAVADAAQALERLAQTLNSSEPPGELARQLAGEQEQRAAAARNAARDPATASDPGAAGRLTAAQQQVNQLPAPGAAEQKQSAARSLAAARDAEQALARARQSEPADATEPSAGLQAALDENATRQTEAATALAQLADQLSRPESEQALAQSREQAGQLAEAAANSRASQLASAAQAAAQLAEEQARLREKTEPLMDGLPDRAQQKSQSDAVRNAQQKLADQIAALDPGVNPLAKAEAQSQARAADKSLAAGDARQAASQQAAAQQSPEAIAEAAQAQQANLETPPPAEGQPPGPPAAREPGEPTPSGELAQRARELAEAQRQAARKLQAQSTSNQLASAAGASPEPPQSNRPDSSPPTANADPQAPQQPSSSPVTGNGGSADRAAPNSQGADADQGEGPSKQGQSPGPPPGAMPKEGATPDEPMDRPAGETQSASKDEPADRPQSPADRPGEKPEPMSPDREEQPPRRPEGQSGRPQNTESPGPAAGATGLPGNAPGGSTGDSAPPGMNPGPNSGPNPGPNSGSAPSTEAASDGQPSEQGQPATQGQASMTGRPGESGSPMTEAGEPSSAADSARQAVARQQQVSRELASAALEAAAQAPGTAVSSAASQLAKSAAQTSDDASLGATSQAADEGREMAQQARELARQLEENPVAQGGPQPELAERMRDLANQQDEASGQLSGVSENSAARNAAQAQGQQQLREETRQLEQDFAELADKLKAQPVDRKRQSEQARDARGRSEGASREMQQAMQTAEQGNSGEAAQAASAAAEELRKAARMATEERGFEPGKSPNNPVPNETASQIADAARELQKAGETLADDAPPMSGDPQPGEPGEKGSKMDASQQAADAQSPSPGQQSPGEMQPDDSGNEGLAEGQQEGPPQASEMLKQGAHSLRQAASQLKLRPGESNDQGMPGGEQGESQPTSGQTKQGSASGANEQVRIVDVDAHLEKLSTRNWGELPGKLQTEILQSTRRRPDGDYAPLIRRYFDTISKTQGTPTDRRED